MLYFERFPQWHFEAHTLKVRAVILMSCNVIYYTLKRCFRLLLFSSAPQRHDPWSEVQCKEVFKSCPSIRLQKRHVMEAMCEGEGKAPLFAECRRCLVNDPPEMPVRSVLTDQNPAVPSRLQLRSSAAPIDQSLRWVRRVEEGRKDKKRKRKRAEL